MQNTWFRPEPAPASDGINVKSDWFVAVLFILALAPRLYVALAWGGEAVWDGAYYMRGAMRIAQGAGYSDDLWVNGHAVWHPWCHYPVGYSAALAFFLRVFGMNMQVTHAVNACIGALLAVVTYALARCALSTRRARIAGLLVAAHPGLIMYSALVMTEPLAALLTLCAFWLAVRDRTNPRGAALGALTLGLAALVRPTALLSAPMLAIGVPRSRGSRPIAFFSAAAVVMSLVTLVPILPWTARNCHVMDGCALVSTNAGWNLTIGALPRATGRFEQLLATDGCPTATGQVEQDRCWFARGVALIRENPMHWLSLIPAKLSYTFDHESFAVEYLHEGDRARWPEARRVRGRAFLSTVHRLLVCVAALVCIGVPFRRRKGAMSNVTQIALFAGVAAMSIYGFAADTPIFWPIVLVTCVLPWLPLPGRPAFAPALCLPLFYLATTMLAHAIFFGEDRYHIVVSPVFCLLAAAALRPSADRSPDEALSS